MSRLPNLNVTISSGNLSDMFFNMSHDDRDKLYRERPFDQPIADHELRDTLREDARDLQRWLGLEPDDAPGGLTENLISDFLGRV